MNLLVQETCCAKGTLYLNFTTRLEILASLCVQCKRVRIIGWAQA